jgi:hypothetical protein
MEGKIIFVAVASDDVPADRHGLAVLAVSVVGLRLLWLHVHRPAQLAENAATYGSIRNFHGAAQMNHDGSKFIYAATADDRGRSIFLCDTATGKKQQIIKDTLGVGIWDDDFDVQAGPWSPDDSCFVCVVNNRTIVLRVDALADRTDAGPQRQPPSRRAGARAGASSGRFATERAAANAPASWTAVPMLDRDRFGTRLKLITHVNAVSRSGDALVPLGDFVAGQAVFEAEAELIAEDFGEAGDFADGGHGNLRFGICDSRAGVGRESSRAEAQDV